MARKKPSKEISVVYSITVPRWHFFGGDISTYTARSGFPADVLCRQVNTFCSESVWIVPGTGDATA